MTYATIPLEPFPSLASIAKLLFADTVIVADNLAYNKRQKPNQIAITKQIQLTLDVTNKTGHLKQLELINSSTFNRKLIRCIEDHYSKAPYFHFLFEAFCLNLTKSRTYSAYSATFLAFLFTFIKAKPSIYFASQFSEEFDLKTVHANMSAEYFSEPEYVSYLETIGINDIKPFKFSIKSPENYHTILSKDLTYFDLLFEWGPYLKNLFQIDSND